MRAAGLASASAVSVLAFHVIVVVAAGDAEVPVAVTDRPSVCVQGWGACEWAIERRRGEGAERGVPATAAGHLPQRSPPPSSNSRTCLRGRRDAGERIEGGNVGAVGERAAGL